MKFVVNSNGEYYHLLEKLKCPLRENEDDFIILKDGEVFYWVRSYGRDFKYTIQKLRLYISDVKDQSWSSSQRKEITLNFLKEVLSKMVAYERAVKIDQVLDKCKSEDTLWLAC